MEPAAQHAMKDEERIEKIKNSFGKEADAALRPHDEQYNFLSLAEDVGRIYEQVKECLNHAIPAGQKVMRQRSDFARFPPLRDFDFRGLQDRATYVCEHSDYSEWFKSLKRKKHFKPVSFDCEGRPQSAALAPGAPIWKPGCPQHKGVNHRAPPPSHCYHVGFSKNLRNLSCQCMDKAVYCFSFPLATHDATWQGFFYTGSRHVPEAGGAPQDVVDERELKDALQAAVFAKISMLDAFATLYEFLERDWFWVGEKVEIKKGTAWRGPFVVKKDDYAHRRIVVEDEEGVDTDARYENVRHVEENSDSAKTQVL